MIRETKNTFKAVADCGLETMKLQRETGLALGKTAQATVQAASSFCGASPFAEKCKKDVELVGDWIQTSGERYLNEREARWENATTVGLAVLDLAESSSMTDFQIRMDEITTRTLAWARNEAHNVVRANAMRMDILYAPF